MTRRMKSLGQIAYEAGHQPWGPWPTSSQLVRDVHEQAAKAVEKAVKRRLKKGSK